MNKIITIFGGTGFLGRYVVKHPVAAGDIKKPQTYQTARQKRCLLSQPFPVASVVDGILEYFPNPILTGHKKEFGVGLCD